MGSEQPKINGSERLLETVKVRGYPPEAATSPGEAPGERTVVTRRFKTFWRSLQKMAAAARRRRVP
jgi:hypothetical protein